MRRFNPLPGLPTFRPFEALRDGLVERGLRTLHARHTCVHRVDALLSICAELDGGPRVRGDAHLHG